MSKHVNIEYIDYIDGSKITIPQMFYFLTPTHGIFQMFTTHLADFSRHKISSVYDAASVSM
jgi:hypothetical protein